MFSCPAEEVEHGHISSKSWASSSPRSLLCFLIGILERSAVGRGQESRMALSQELKMALNDRALRNTPGV